MEIGGWPIYQIYAHTKLESKFLLVNFNSIVHFWLHHIERCTENSLCACMQVLREQDGTGGCGWGHPQGDIHMVAVVAGCRNALVGYWVGQFLPWLQKMWSENTTPTL